MPAKLKKIITVIAVSASMLVPVLIPATSAACTNNIQNQIDAGQAAATGSSPTNCSGGSVSNGIASIAKEIVNIMSMIVGVIAVIMIIYAGFKYITSGGESNGVSSAKNSLIYAIVGLIIVALAQIIVHLVLNTSSNISSNVSGFLTLFR